MFKKSEHVVQLHHLIIRLILLYVVGGIEINRDVDVPHDVDNVVQIRLKFLAILRMLVEKTWVRLQVFHLLTSDVAVEDVEHRETGLAHLIKLLGLQLAGQERSAARVVNTPVSVNPGHDFGLQELHILHRYDLKNLSYHAPYLLLLLNLVDLFSCWDKLGRDSLLAHD